MANAARSGDPELAYGDHVPAEQMQQISLPAQALELGWTLGRHLGLLSRLSGPGISVSWPEPEM